MSTYEIYRAEADPEEGSPYTRLSGDLYVKAEGGSIFFYSIKMNDPVAVLPASRFVVFKVGD